MFTLKLEGPIHVHVHVDSPLLLARVADVSRKVDQVLAQGVTMNQKATTITTLLQQLDANTTAEAAENAAQTEAIVSIEARIAALIEQIAAGTKGLTEAEADEAIAALTAMQAAAADVRNREELQSARLTALGSPTSDEPVPAPVDVEPIV